MLSLLSLLSNPAVGTFVGAIVGALTSIATTQLANKYELKNRREERYDIRIEALRQSQINELTALEKHMASWGRQMVVYYSSIINELKKEPEVGSSVLGDQDAAGLMRAEQVQIMLHNGLILDERIRRAVQDLTSDLCLSNDAEVLENYLNRKILESRSVLELIEARHRELLLWGLSKEDAAVYGGAI